MTNPSSFLLCAESVCCAGVAGEIRGLSLAIDPRKFTLLSGPGAGALLRILGLLDRPGAGEVWFDSRPTSALDDAARLELRNRSFGYVFAEPFLLDSFTVAENVAMPLFKISGHEIEHARLLTSQVLDFAGLIGAADYCVADLSLLDQHKLAFARALANSPQVLIAEDAALHLAPAEVGEFAALLRAAPGQLGVTIVATSPAGSAVLSPDKEIRIEQGAVVLPTVEEAPAHE